MEIVIEFAFIDQLGMIGVHWFNFDCNFEISARVDGLVDLPKGSLVNLSYNFEIFADFFQHLWHEIYYMK